ncbi:MAG: fibronectin-binding domain-containing protein [Firmicutes bacterium]|nr:fibronectin-binding domain-containing protein [Bacillota bacterium]
MRAISPLAARELIYRSKWDEEAPLGSLERLTREMKALFGKSGALEACLAPQLNIYASYPLTHLQESTLQKFTKMSELLDHYYSRLEEAEERKLLQDRLRSRVNRRKRSLEMKLEQLKRDLLQAGEADRYRIYGETLLTYGTGINSRAEEIILPSLYQPDEKITIPMNPSLDALGNAQKYFRIYRKISNSRKHLKKHISRLQGELAYCRELLYTIEEGSAASLLEIREELVESGYMKPDSRKKPQRKKKRRREKPQPLSFLASSGKKILVGQNNRQNDHLTFKLATRYDIWLHAQRLPGSHVIIKGAGTGPPAESDLQEAALLAAHYSRGRDLPAVAVDYTEVRHVKRAPGGRPGFVLYEPFKTIIVNPQEEELRHLLEQQSSTPPKNPEYG